LYSDTTFVRRSQIRSLFKNYLNISSKEGNFDDGDDDDNDDDEEEDYDDHDAG
jgi:hypothetical protein